ncbi:MAG: anion permease [Holosporales bacterium]
MPKSWHGANLKTSAIVILVGLLLWFMPVPEGLEPKTWQLFAIFVSTILAVILKPLPIGGVALLGITLCAATHTLTIEQCLSSFGSHVVWLVIFAFFLARGFIQTGLGSRIAYFFTATFGKSTLGLAYGLTLSELLLAPMVPSNTARGAGIVFPVVRALAEELGSTPAHHTERKLGAYLIQVCFQVNAITSAMFLTALVGNPLVASLAGAHGVVLDWLTWAKLAVVPGILNLIVLPAFIYRIYPPKMKKSPEAVDMAKARLRELGPLKTPELIMVGTFAVLLVLWIFGSYLGVDPTVAAMLGVSALVFSGVLTWGDLVKEKGAWETLVWFGILLTMATFLNKFGFMQWFGGHVKTLVSGYTWPVALAILGAVYFYSHYFFASITAHITSMYSAFLVVLLAAGAPPMVAAMSLAVFSSLSGPLTHYGTGTAPVFFGSHYVTVKDWWRVGLLSSFLNILIWGTVGAVWWRILGYY